MPDSMLDGVKFRGDSPGAGENSRVAAYLVILPREGVATLSSMGWGVGRHRNCDGRFLPSVPHLLSLTVAAVRSWMCRTQFRPSLLWEG